MFRSNANEESLREFPRVGRGRADDHQGCHWVRHRPVTVVHIDLDQDDCQDIAQKLDRWERLVRNSTI